jgi:hypothetical protein
VVLVVKDADELRVVFFVVEALLVIELDFNIVITVEDVEYDEVEISYSKHEQPLDTRVVEHALKKVGIAGCDVLQE